MEKLIQSCQELFLLLNPTVEQTILPVQKMIKLKDLIVRMLESATADSPIAFSSPGARAEYLAGEKKISSDILYLVEQALRKIAKSEKNAPITPTDLLLIEQTALKIGTSLTQIPIPEFIQNKYAGVLNTDSTDIRVDFLHTIRAKVIHVNLYPPGLLVEIADTQQQMLIIGFTKTHTQVNTKLMNASSAWPLAMHFNIYQNNIEKVFQDFCHLVWKEANVNLIMPEHIADNQYTVAIIILEPDYLIDVSRLAECFQHNGTTPESYLLNKFELPEVSKPKTLGNIVNSFLDQLIHQNPNQLLEYKEAIKRCFRADPLGFTMYDDTQIKEMIKEAKNHFLAVSQVIEADLAKLDINPQDCVLEPSFLSEIFGIQGRLDLLHLKLLADSSVKIDIIELKSGKSPANSGLWPNHWMQTVLYDMLINSVFGIQRSGGNTMILYSADTTQNRIRYSKTHHLYYRMIASEVRNRLIYFEKSIAQSPEKAEIIISHHFWPDRIEKFPPYTQLRLKQIQKYIGELNITEKSYFFHYISLIAREQWVSKVGNEFRAGQAALWKLTLEEKQQEGIIITNLKLVENQADNIENPQLIFIRYPATADPEAEMYVTNFRNGDTVLCYPVTNENQTAPVLTQQLFKGNLFYETETHQYLFRLKYPQQQILNQELEWRIEPDTNDNNFTALHRNMFEWAAAAPEKRALILGLREPISNDHNTIIIEKAADLTPSQTQLLQKALAAQEYFLLQGPPGTGKTSKMIKHLVKYLIANTQANIMLVAHTRRAVEEIIQAVETAFEELALPADYIKIGQEENPSPRSLEYIARNATRREDLTKPIAAARVFVSTLFSLYSRHEIFKLKKFDTLIVDEASQLLEPHLCGILTRFHKFILIGDEKQLPAVIQLSPENTAVSKTTDYGKEMHQIGLSNLRNSLFERLLHICQQNGWTHAYGMLTEQGRMHQCIGNFVSQTFYENKLTLLNYERQTRPPYLFSKLSPDPNERMLAANRIVFCHCTPADISVRSKTNLSEAIQVAAFTKLFIEKIQAHNEPINEATLGIITPFRAQISLIRQQLRKEFQNHPLQHLLENITIETVERYQGSTRRIIIISFVITQPQQFSQISAWNDEKTVDRKLNVALSRAQEYIVICGNEEILSTEPVYRKLIAYAAENTLD